jgi:DNA primase
MLSAAEIAHALGGKRTGQTSFVAKCPAHKDRTPSLSLSDVDGWALWYCHAGCSQRDVRDA